MTVTGEKSCFFSSSGLPAYKQNKPKKIKKNVILHEKPP